MSKIIVEIDRPSNVKRFFNILEDLKYVKFYTAEKEEAKDLIRLTDEDWIKPGRPATYKEFEQLATAMEEDKGGYDSATALKMTLKEISEWRKEKSR
jgi:hypothetical protein